MVGLMVLRTMVSRRVKIEAIMSNIISCEQHCKFDVLRNTVWHNLQIVDRGLRTVPFLLNRGRTSPTGKKRWEYN